MILYYSGTGNSEFVAKKMAELLKEPILNCFEKLRQNDCSEIYSKTPWIVVCPTYGWQIPHLLRDWIKNVHLSGSKEIYFVMTCGEDNGNASRYLMQLCDELKMNYRGSVEIVMPENYLALFPVPQKDEAVQIIQKAFPIIEQVVKCIEEQNDLPNKKVTMVDQLKSGPINTIFYQAIVHSKKFYVKESCIGCGKCEQVCVLNNIHLENKKPVWGNTCTHCMACICHCPTQAIEYGRATKNKPRYLCPDMEK